MIKVLIVENDDKIRKELIKLPLWDELDCFIMGMASNGMDGINSINTLSPDLVISAIKMPIMDGLTMVEFLRNENNNIPVIFLTSHENFSFIQKALRLEVSDYLLKPINMEEIEQSIRRITLKLTKINEEAYKQEFPPLKSQNTSRYIYQTMDYIRLNYNDSNLTLKKIAQHLEISEGHLSHLFKKETGTGPLSFLTYYRIYQAKNFLQNYKTKIYEVTEKVGYKDVAHFSSTFKKITGISPRDYQNSFRVK